MGRLMALLILVIPGILATIGIKIMRDALFGVFYPIFFYLGIQFFIGLIFFLGGLSFIAGFIFYRDKKRNLTKGKGRSKKKR
ncbi:DUF2627 domain-containing protein [Terrihalobacillus insolitus]|uniref:DUF2627 domain-containing protein n=1 Tax=Terrihalobacillus insolitus TaxID=2950438 RepID=UPI002340FE7C|nr:DUF2627 domain-containing protein [Terrihalobacillus insolitus]MDC3414447.1 DUF2627 domain-containing protein [Terrihalobacillus insolitus]